MLFVPPQQPRWTAHFASGWWRKRPGARRPQHGRRLNADRIGESQCFESLAKGTVVAIGSISQYDGTRHILVHQPADMIERHVRLGLKSNLFGHAGLLAPLWIVGPYLGKIELIGSGNAGMLSGKRYAHRHSAVILFAQLTAILARDSNRMSSLLGESSVIHDPSCQLMLLGHRRHNLTPHLLQKRVIVPGRIGHDVMQRLMHLAYVAGSQPRCHRLHTLALDRKHQALGVVFDGNYSIRMSGFPGQTIQIGLQTLRLAREIRPVAAHRSQRRALLMPAPEKSRQRYAFYNRVVLDSQLRLCRQNSLTMSSLKSRERR